MQPVRVLVADPLSAFRRLVRLHLEQHPRFVVVAEAHDPHSAVEQARRFRPDVALVEWEYHGAPSPGIVKSLVSASPQTRVVLYTESEPGLQASQDDGSVEWLPKSVEPPELARRLEKMVVEGGT